MKTSKLHKLTTFFLVCVFLFSAYKVGAIGKEYYDNRKVLKQVQVIYNENEDFEVKSTGQPRQQFNKLLEINPDIVGWIEVEETNINYPILQADNNDYYLNRNYLKEESRAGRRLRDRRYVSGNVLWNCHRYFTWQQYRPWYLPWYAARSGNRQMYQKGERQQ